MEVCVWCRTGYSSMGPPCGLRLVQNASLTLNNNNYLQRIVALHRETVFTIQLFFCILGYVYTFPFLHKDCGVTCIENYVWPLFKHTININNPTMCFIGLPFYVCANAMFDLQVSNCEVKDLNDDLSSSQDRSSSSRD